MSASFLLIGVALFIGLCYKLPAFVSGNRNPLARQVAGLLLAACAVFFFAAPSTIAAVNDYTGIPNFAAPLVYSLLTGFSASCLLLIAKWRGGTPESLRRTTWWVYGSYGALVAVLWACFALSDHSVERVRDLDTYYATTPWMREMILLYLLGHTVAVLITCSLLWSWESRVRGTGWLHIGVLTLSVGYVANLAYDGTKLAAVFGRWSGTTALDGLSTQAAPPIAALAGILVALGFIVPHVGERMSQRTAARREFRALAPLATTLRTVPSASAPVDLGRFASLELRLTQRRTFVRDAVRVLQPYLDAEHHDRVERTYLEQGKKPARAKALADASTVAVAVAHLPAAGSQPPEPPTRPLLEGLGDLISVSRAMRKLPQDHAVRWEAPRPEESVTS
ncbi:MAB_1171c family putative transporter [Streptomyces sp. NPDC058762]|uniref:MAB_1171c family putative transporter n=1 Tax=Streptomyces sp. NPDC058762 TaxID=3346629 RepID=UPI00367A9BF6